jgi:cellulose synthase/poly-beta-1,6-N-acetylglucosamine synthase-like glycosyltransferase
MNLGSKLRDWFKVHNVLEYFFWFSSRMFVQTDANFTPLGGNTVFIRRSLLEQAGGWPINLTEDCALGVHLSTKYNAKIVAAYDPALVTREETPDTVRNLVKQRTRWSQGFLSVLTLGEWRNLQTLRLRLMAWYFLATPFLQAASGLIIPLCLLFALVVHAPVLLVLLTFLPFVPILISFMLQVAGLHEFGHIYPGTVKVRHYAFLFAGFWIYQLVLMWAAIRAAWRYSRNQFDWEKTMHPGAHRESFELAEAELAYEEAV